MNRDSIPWAQGVQPAIVDSRSSSAEGRREALNSQRRAPDVPAPGLRQESRPRPPSFLSEPEDPLSASLLPPPLIESAPGPPKSVSLPEPPLIRSFFLFPSSPSSPARPLMKSASCSHDCHGQPPDDPVLPMKLPRITSFPGPPISRSPSGPPAIPSSPGPPETKSAPGRPRKVSSPLPPQIESATCTPEMSSEPGPVILDPGQSRSPERRPENPIPTSKAFGQRPRPPGAVLLLPTF